VLIERPRTCATALARSRIGPCAARMAAKGRASGAPQPRPGPLTHSPAPPSGAMAQLPRRRLPMGPVHFIDLPRPGQLRQYPYSIGRLADLPALDPGLSAQPRPVGVHLRGGLFGQFAPRMGPDRLIGPYHELTVEGCLST